MKKMGQIACLALSAALLFGACAPSPRPAPTAEPDLEVAAEAVLELAAQEARAEASFAKKPEAEPEAADLPLAAGESADEAVSLPVSALADSVLPLASASEKVSGIEELDLSIPQTFAVTRPTEKINTTYSSYFITGTSDPNQSLTIGGSAITRNGTMGTWGVLVNLSVGTNTFTVRQGDKSETVTIVRTVDSVSTISEIRQSSMYPATQGGVKAGETMLVECIAPSGATVTASFEGRSVTLQQVASASAGIPATYRGELLVEGDYPANETTLVGKVTYQLRWNGATTSYQSTGDMYVAGVGSRIAVRVTDSIGPVYSNTSQLSVFRQLLKEGSSDYVTGEDNSYFKLASGGYLPKGQAEIITGQVSIANTLSAVSFASTEKKETYTFHGTATPAFLTSVKDGVFYLTIYNTNGTPSADSSGSKLFSQAGVTDNGGSVTYSFPFKNSGQYAGYNVSYDGNDLQLRLQYKPTIDASSATPLTGVVIMIDPGHGGTDPGAYGVAGSLGPNEADLNLACAFATRDALTALGATVHLTHTGGGQTVELHDRLHAFEQSEADLFISIHHNSVAESANANTISGTEVYYHTSGSSSLASSLLSSISSGLNRTARHYRQSYYRVTILPQAPSVLAELGFMSNPVEYEKATTLSEINRSAQAIATGVVNALK